MITKLVIAGIKFVCKVPENILYDTILNFSEEFTGNEDINLEISYTDKFDVPKEKSITNDILEWYIIKDGIYKYHLIKKDDNTLETIVSLKANEFWSDVIIEAKYDNEVSVEVINILLLEIVFRNRLLFHEGLVLHSSAIEFAGEAVAFTAPSGTGKSTHVSLWEQKYGVKVINDDHPAIRIIDQKPVIFGTPWAGEQRKFNNSSSPLKAVVILKQGAVNKIRKVNNSEVIREFLPRCFIPYYDNKLVAKALGIFNQIMEVINVYSMSCTKDEEAVMLVHDCIWAENSIDEEKL